MIVAALQELRDRHQLRVELIPSSDNCADLCTKAHRTV